MARFFIGGCNVAFPLTNEFDLDPAPCVWQYELTPGGRKVRALALARDHAAALEACRKCPHAVVQPYLEQAPEGDPEGAPAGDPEPAAEPTFEPAAAAPEPRSAPDPDPTDDANDVPDWNAWGAMVESAAPLEVDPASIPAPAGTLADLGWGFEPVGEPEAPAPAPELAGPPRPSFDCPSVETCGLKARWDSCYDCPAGHGPERPAAAPAPEPAPAAPPLEPFESETDGVIPFDPTAHKSWDGGFGPTGPVPPLPEQPPAFVPGAAGAPPAPAAPVRGRPTVDSLLGVQGGQSVFGNSRLRGARTCLRLFYYKEVQGLQVYHEPGPSQDSSGKVHLSPLEVGIGVHACAELYYKSCFDQVTAQRAVDAIKRAYPPLATEVNRLWGFYLHGFHDIDSRTWDIRGVELETRYFYPKRRVRGKQLSVCISARHDTVVRVIAPAAARLAAEEASPEGVWIHDLKTIAQISDGACRAWRHESQGLQNLLCFGEGFPVEPADPERGTPKRVGTTPAVVRYGAPQGLIITHIGKAKEQDPHKHLKRTKYVLDPTLVAAFRDETGGWLYEVVIDRLAAPAATRDDPATWPRSFLACRDPMTNRACEYLPLCESNGRADPERVGFVRRPPLELAQLVAVKGKAGRKKRGAGPAKTEDK